jgi:hypothetical protein
MGRCKEMTRQELEAHLGQPVRLNYLYGSIPPGTLCTIATVSEATVTVMCQPEGTKLQVKPEHVVTEQEWLQKNRSQ